MKTLDRYIIRQFLMNFVILTFVILALFVLVDMIIDIDEFIDAGQLRAAGFGGSVWIGTVYSVIDYYGPMVLLVYIFLSGLLVVTAVGFTLTAFVRTGEIVGMVASGVSMYRIAAPLLIVGCLLNAITLPLQEFVIPRLADKLARGKGQAKYDTIESFEVRFSPDGVQDKPGNLWTAAQFNPREKTLKQVSILVRDKATGQAIGRVTADKAQWNQGLERWDLTNGREVSRELGADLLAANPQRQARAVDFFRTNLSPTVLLARRATIYPRLLGLRDLRSMADNPAADGAMIRRIMHSRFSLIVINVLVLVMALPFFLLREPSGMARKTLQAAGLCLAAWGVALVIMQTGSHVEPVHWTYLPGFLEDLVDFGARMLTNPVTASWLAVVVFLPLSAFLMQKTRT